MQLYTCQVDEGVKRFNLLTPRWSLDVFCGSSSACYYQDSFDSDLVVEQDDAEYPESGNTSSWERDSIFACHQNHS